MPRYNQILITGAAGNLGRVLRKGLAPLASRLRLTDRGEMAPPDAHEETVVCELGDFDAVMKAVEGCDAIVHFGAALSTPVRFMLSVTNEENPVLIQTHPTIQIRCMAFPNASSKIWLKCILTSLALNQPACALIRVTRNPLTEGIWLPG